ncbi:uncharacterized protein LAJ45_10838 [Morchella importuna]|uniref:uncharacterized protein n=1 Tax=Morchella importuna TaxID=1174673 RepID=UPI001E8CE5AE|nr:uncharacterized protein LAJ45_10838 [Morchella importuna]KAH8145174.1 hypothetical protein LAJ45_10838 [Morchella importuna]
MLAGPPPSGTRGPGIHIYSRAMVGRCTFLSENIDIFQVINRARIKARSMRLQETILRAPRSSFSYERNVGVTRHLAPADTYDVA